MQQAGLLLVNLGTPAAPQTRPVRRYLAEFLSDPRVIDIGPVRRWLLLHLIILRTRPRRSAAAYREIWTERGSPLLYHSQDLAAALRESLGDDIPVALAMRYQEPSIAAGLAALREAGVDRVVLFPLFPHNSSSAWGSAVEKVYREAGRLWNVPGIEVVDPYYDHPAFIAAFADNTRAHWGEAPWDHVIFTFHGLPERHVRKGDESGGQHCLRRESCCAAIGGANRNCYRAQCYATARALAAALELEPDRWEVAFQSRLGRDPWIRPYTDERVDALADAGKKRVLVVSPSFVADCLETLEEIGMRAAADFRARGGEELRLVPSLNAQPNWVAAVRRILTEQTSLMQNRPPNGPV